MPAEAARTFSRRAWGAVCRSVSRRLDDSGSALPHCLQKLAADALSVPQRGQRVFSGLPQFWQKWASTGLSCKQSGQFTAWLPGSAHGPDVMAPLLYRSTRAVSGQVRAGPPAMDFSARLQRCGDAVPVRANRLHGCPCSWRSESAGEHREAEGAVICPQLLDRVGIRSAGERLCLLFRAHPACDRRHMSVRMHQKGNVPAVYCS